MEKSEIYCLDTLEKVLNLDQKEVCMLCGSSVNGGLKVQGAYENTFYLVFLLFLLSAVHSVSLCDLCNVICNILRHS